MMRIYLLSMSSGLQQAAAEQSSYTLTVTTTRGRIYDRRMQPLTDTEQHDLIAVLPTAQAAQDCAKQIEGTARRAALDRIAQGTPFLLDITGKDGEREKVYSQDVENITTAARLPHDPTEQRAVHLLGYRDSEGKGLTGIERAFDSRLEKAGEDAYKRQSPVMQWVLSLPTDRIKSACTTGWMRLNSRQMQASLAETVR